MEISAKKYLLKAFRCSENEMSKIKLLQSELKNKTGIDTITESEIIRKAINVYYDLLKKSA